MCMDTGAVTGNNKILLRYQAFLDRGSHSSNQKDVLKNRLKIEKDIPSGFEPGSDLFGDILMAFGCLLAFFLRLIGFGSIAAGRKKFRAGIGVFIMEKPEAVHEIKIRA